MRVTNQMINQSSLKNLQKTQSRVSETTTQLTSGKIIQKASEDPVIAMRALKLRSTVSQLAQYKDKNIKDANNWMEVTETSLNNIISRLTDIYDLCVQGANDTYDSAARSSIMESLRSYQEMIYAEGSATYAGRYLFSGYRTGTDLSFSTEASINEISSYDITEHLDSTDFKTKAYVTDEIDYDSVDAYIAGTATYTAPRDATAYVLKLAYDNLDDTSITLSFDGQSLNDLGYSFVIKDSTQADSYYDVGDDEVAYIPETGELVFGTNAYNALKSSEDIQVDYTKSEFEVGDLRPDHYFDCVKHEIQSDGSIKDIQFEQPEGGQNIQYEVNFNQYITVNTQGKDTITHDMGNTIDELTTALQELTDIEETITRLNSLLNDPNYADDEDAVAFINQMLEDADIEMALKRDNVTNLFEKAQTTFTNYINDVSALQSDVGTRMNKLDMISTRVSEQYANFSELKSANEDIEEEEVIIEFNQAQVTYSGALAAVSNILQTTLLDYL